MTEDNKKFDKWAVRAKKAKDIEVDAQGFHGITAGQVKQWQREFQQEFCHLCFYFDPKKADFIKKGRQNDPSNCLHHWIDIIGQCWNYRERETTRHQ